MGHRMQSIDKTVLFMYIIVRVMKMSKVIPPPEVIVQGYSIENCLAVLYVWARDLYFEVESAAETCNDDEDLLAFARSCVIRAIEREKQ